MQACNDFLDWAYTLDTRNKLPAKNFFQDAIYKDATSYFWRKKILLEFSIEMEVPAGYKINYPGLGYALKMVKENFIRLFEELDNQYTTIYSRKWTNIKIPPFIKMPLWHYLRRTMVYIL